MNILVEPARELAVQKFDVAVAGAGTGGVIAAIAAARQGVRTLVIESKGYPGGIAVEGGTALHSFYNLWTAFPGVEKKQVVRGIPQELVDRLVEAGGCSGHAPMDRGIDYDSVCTAIDVEIYKRVAFEMMEEAGVVVAVNSMVAGAIMDGDSTVRGVLVESRSGREAILARAFIDATGFGDLAAHSGANFAEPNDYPVANSIGVGGVDIEKYCEFFAATNALVQTAYGWRDGRENRLVRVQGNFSKACPELGEDAKKIGLSSVITSTHDDYFMFLKLNYKMPENPTNRDALAKAEIELRRRQTRAIELLRKHVPGCEKAFIARSSPSVCIRRGRCIDCDYDVTLDDIVKGRRFEDEVYLYGFHDCAPRIQIRNGGYYGMPFRAMLPVGIDNLLVTGMMITSDWNAHMSTRNTVSCMAMGQAAGTAAALCAEKDCRTRDLSYAELRRALLDGGVYLE